MEVGSVIGNEVLMSQAMKVTHMTINHDVEEDVRGNGIALYHSYDFDFDK